MSLSNGSQGTGWKSICLTNCSTLMEYTVILKKHFARAEVVRQLSSGNLSWGAHPLSCGPAFTPNAPFAAPFGLLQGLTGSGGFGSSGAPRLENNDVALYNKSERGGKQLDYYDFGAGQVLVYDRRIKYAYWQKPVTATREGLTQQDYVDAAKELGVEPEAIMAIAQQESHGGGFFQDGQPKILFERHKMFLYLKKERKDIDTLANKVNADIVNPKSGGYNTAKQYDKLARARTIDENAALQSASWGRFQVMGENYRYLYKTPQEMEKAMRTSEKQQLMFFIAFLRKKAGGKLVKALKSHTWEKVASYYNGSKWREKNPQYAHNLQKFYEKFKREGIQK